MEELQPKKPLLTTPSYESLRIQLLETDQKKAFLEDQISLLNQSLAAAHAANKILKETLDTKFPGNKTNLVPITSASSPGSVVATAGINRLVDYPDSEDSFTKTELEILSKPHDFY